MERSTVRVREDGFIESNSSEGIREEKEGMREGEGGTPGREREWRAEVFLFYILIDIAANFLSGSVQTEVLQERPLEASVGRKSPAPVLATARPGNHQPFTPAAHHPSVEINRHSVKFRPACGTCRKAAKKIPTTASLFGFSR
ncbi:hypothetical protein PoB_005969800 [Plakobranchus ocellatus]|uniref:Uncharacterized protein n=1 Tax=Plakobranchus ocellatus TaxID=259542 RepID=A0AAV4CNB2_9GAST|nr:hypothetical protein PoB_005969800 [Plakobranchus ocellatus]